ncbi:uncharacterized protein LOC107484241 [Arachis duranensis]|uniref:Uncharacterized protein LOC107484241 n=1 Tax=Arachis duranensis TaxID=130453 RepID=A0A6P4D711_ARADU|nr:uncharacterized protein LOC107484241 [Arachis duranensis]XP_025618262.1 uncharacterized protein LOC112710284 [Arachis hypogaea]
MSPYQLVYDKACHLPMKLEHRAYWATKFLKFNTNAAGEKRLLQLDDFDEFRVEVYENAKLYKEKTKMWQDKRISTRIFDPGQMVLLFNSRLKRFSRKLKSRWFGVFTITKVSPYGYVEVMEESSGRKFIVNGQRLKHYLGGDIDCQRTIQLLT